MKRNPKKTPRSKIKKALGLLWLRSRERNYALKRDHYTCQKCKKKRSTSKGSPIKVEVHHKEGIEWENIIAYIEKHLLVPPEKLETLCHKCHKEKGDERNDDNGRRR